MCSVVLSAQCTEIIFFNVSLSSWLQNLCATTNGFGRGKSLDKVAMTISSLLLKNHGSLFDFIGCSDLYCVKVVPSGDAAYILALTIVMRLCHEIEPVVTTTSSTQMKS